MNTKELQDTESKTNQGFWRSFMEFLRQYSVIGLAIGVVMGAAVNNLVQSLVQGVITPLIALLMPNGGVDALVFSVRDSEFRVGDVISATLQFIIIAFLIYFVVKFLLKQEELIRKK